MMSKKQLERWLKTLPKDSDIAIDDGGLQLIEIDTDGEETGDYLEIGGKPEDER